MRPLAHPWTRIITYRIVQPQRGKSSRYKTDRYREAVGSLLWLANGTELDFAFKTNQVARRMEDPRVKHWDAILRITQYLRGTQNVGIVFDGSVTMKDTCGYFLLL